MTTECNLFSKSFTNRGVGYAFNHEPFWNLYRNTSENAAFFSEIVEEINSTNSDPRKVVSNGRSFALKFVVQHHEIKTREDKCDLNDVE